MSEKAFEKSDEDLEDLEEENTEDEDSEDQDALLMDELGPELIECTIKNDYEKVEQLLLKKVDATWTDNKGWNSLMWAACRGRTDILRLLLKHNAQEP